MVVSGPQEAAAAAEAGLDCWEAAVRLALGEELSGSERQSRQGNWVEQAPVLEFGAWEGEKNVLEGAKWQDVGIENLPEDW